MIDLQRATGIGEALNFDPHQWRMLDSLISHHPVFDHLLWREANARSSETFFFREDEKRVAASLAGMGRFSMMSLFDPNHSAALIEAEEDVCANTVGAQFVTSLFYGNPRINPNDFYGLSSYFNTMDSAAALNAVNVLGAGGEGEGLFSIWLVGWGEDVYMAYPKGSDLGLLMERFTADSVVPFKCAASFFGIRAALVVRDWRKVVRIANLSERHTRRDMMGLMDRAILAMPHRSPSRRFYLGGAARNIWCGDGGEDMYHREIPIDCVDQLSAFEAQVQGSRFAGGNY